MWPFHLAGDYARTNVLGKYRLFVLFFMKQPQIDVGELERQIGELRGEPGPWATDWAFTGRLYQEMVDDHWYPTASRYEAGYTVGTTEFPISKLPQAPTLQIALANEWLLVTQTIARRKAWQSQWQTS